MRGMAGLKADMTAREKLQIYVTTHDQPKRALKRRVMNIQLIEYPIPPHPRAPAVPQKTPSVDISETESGIIDPLVSKRPETN